MKILKKAFLHILVFSILSSAVPCVALAENSGSAQAGVLETSNINDVMLSDGFESGLGKTNKFVTGYSKPVGWEFEDSRNPIESVLVAGVTTEEKAAGEASLKIPAVERNNVGFISPKIPITDQTPGFDITVKVKASEDYLNNHPAYVLYFYDGDYRAHTTVGETLTVSKDGWTENVCHIDYTSYPDYGVRFDSVRVKLISAYDGKNGVPGTGTLYYDDFSVTKSYEGAYIIHDVRADKLLGWYILGETVTFKPEKAIPDSMYEIKAVVRNAYEEVLYEHVLSTQEFQRNGWKYTPKEIGYYKVSFYGKTDYGEVRLVSAYRTGTKKVGTFLVEERTIVVANETKPLEERNKSLTYSSHAVGGGIMTDYDSNWDLLFDMSEMIGFTGMRLHVFPWEQDLGSIDAPNPGKGMYDWSGLDKFFKYATKKDISLWACVLQTPEWASTYAGNMSTPSAKVPSLVGYKLAPPTRTEYYTEYLTKLAERYGEHIDIWEIWCETTPRCAYFKYGTVEEYANLLSTSYNLLKEIQPGDEVLMAGMIRNNADYYAQLLDAGIYEYSDAMVIHQRWPDYENYYAEEEARGLSGKPWTNGEAHYNLLSTEYGYQSTTEREEAFDMITGYFWDIRENVDKIALFQIDESGYDRDCLEFKKSLGERALSYGLWRRRPFAEPKLVAMALHTFFQEMGTEFKYVDEYRFEDDVTAMHFSNEGKPWVAVWSEYADAKFPEEIKNCMTENTKIIDWEGKVVSIDDTMRKGTIYMINGLDAEALDAIPTADYSVLVARRKIMEQESDIVVEGNKEQIFDEITFEESKNISWIEDTGWTWRAKVSGEEQKDYKARFAVSVNEKGVYLMIEADDNTPFFENYDQTRLYETDSVQIGIDVTGERYDDMRTEIDVANTPEGIVIYKRANANIFGAIPTDWTASNNVLDSKYAKVSAKDGKLLYKIFIPASELFPFEYHLLDNKLKIALALNDNDGTSRRGQLLWADGIDGGKNVGKYGTVILP